MRIDGENIYIRNIEASDTQDILRWRNQEAVRKYFINQEPFTVEGHTAWLNQYIATGKAAQFILVDKENDFPFGSVYLRDIDMVHRKAEFGIFIGEDKYRGHGFGTQAAKLILKYGFCDLELNKIMLRVLADNDRAIKSYKKIGFQEEGYFKKDVYIHGIFQDVIFMAIFRDDFCNN